MVMVSQIRGLEDEFLKGINVHSPESRDFCLEIIEFLRKTPIKWIRIHPLATRRIRAKGLASGISHLDAIEKYAEAGFNLIIPIDVGVKENVGIVTSTHLRRFVDDSYGESFKAVKQIETAIAKYNTRIIYGVENEIDTKEWILQSIPFVRWREGTAAWMELSVNKDLKFRRLSNIMEGIREASPDSLTMVNFEADDPAEDWNSQTSFLIAFQTVFSKLGVLEKDARHRMNNYRLDVGEALRRLKNFDIIGLDNYPNYLTKLPPRGHKIGDKVDQITRFAKKPVINVEFGYPQVNSAGALGPLKILTMPDSDRSTMESIPGAGTEGGKNNLAVDPQKIFFENALGSIENSSSQGTFPWVLFLDPAQVYKPKEEPGFTLLTVGSNRILEPVPALDYYINWLDNVKTRKPEDEDSSTTENQLISRPGHDMLGKEDPLSCDNVQSG